jgi:L-ascorbate metabolism protein UlaG (beta-lactamase superfamily)
MKQIVLAAVLTLTATMSFGQSNKGASIQLIRNATVVFRYAGHEFLIDPMLAERGAYPGFPGTANSHFRNPLVALPVAVDDLLHPDAIFVSHLHPDHWDEAAIKMLPKEIPLFAQDEKDAMVIKSKGFKDVRVLSKSSNFKNVAIQKTAAQHGSDEAYKNPQMAAALGDASGFFFSSPGQKSVYFAGDAIWTDAFEKALKALKPDVVVLNTGFAQVDGFGAIIMGKDDVKKVNKILPDAIIIAIHMEAINHCILTRKELGDYVANLGIATKVFIPLDGEVIKL